MARANTTRAKLAELGGRPYYAAADLRPVDDRLPSPRHHLAGCFDRARGELVVFGGNTEEAAAWSDETWMRRDAWRKRGGAGHRGRAMTPIASTSAPLRPRSPTIG